MSIPAIDTSTSVGGKGSGSTFYLLGVDGQGIGEPQDELIIINSEAK